MDAKRELTDLAVNEKGQLCEIPGIGRMMEYGIWDFTLIQMQERKVNKMFDCYFPDWYEGVFSDEEILDCAGKESTEIYFGFSPDYVDPHKGW